MHSPSRQLSSTRVGAVSTTHSRLARSLSETPEIEAVRAVMEGFEEQSRQEARAVRKHRAAVAQGGWGCSEEQRKPGDVKRAGTSNSCRHSTNLNCTALRRAGVWKALCAVGLQSNECERFQLNLLAGKRVGDKMWKQPFKKLSSKFRAWSTVACSQN